MKIRIAFSILLLSMLSGCGGAITRQAPPQISENEVMEEINWLKSNSAKIKATKQDDKNKTILWIQPDNKKEVCKTFYGTNDGKLPPNYKVYWDGQCKDGYAYGLGRELEKADMRDNEALAEYSGGQVEPKYYMQYYKLEKTVELGNIGDQKFSRKKLVKNDTDAAIDITIINNDINGTGLFYMLQRNTIKPNSVYAKGVIEDMLLYRFTDAVDDPTNVSTELASHKDFRFKIWKYTNGRVQHYDAQQKKEVVFPAVYINEMVSSYTETKAKIEEVMPYIELAEKKKEYYKSLVCKDSVKVDFMPESEYKLICSENEYFAPYMAAVRATTAKIAEKRMERKAQQSELEYKKQSLELQRRQADAASRQAEALEEANNPLSIQNQLRSLQDMNNRNKPVNCSKVGGFVTCF